MTTDTRIEADIRGDNQDEGIAGSAGAHVAPAAGSRRRPVHVTAEEAMVVEAADGVEVRHVVGQSLMLRVLALDPGASLEIAEPEAEHILTVLAGEIVAEVDDRPQRLRADEMLLLPVGGPVTVRGGDSAARCQLLSTPPDTGLVRYLMHLEHDDHGFD